MDSSLNPELILVCAYGQMLVQPFLDIPKGGCYNLHFSFLPKLRGASPVQAAISSGFETTGVCLQKMVLRLDAGPLVATSEKEKILPDDTTHLLGSRLAVIGTSDRQKDKILFVSTKINAATIKVINKVKTEPTTLAISLRPSPRKRTMSSCIPYEIGIAHFKEISRAHIMGEEEGILKLLFDPETLMKTF